MYIVYIVNLQPDLHALLDCLHVFFSFNNPFTAKKFPLCSKQKDEKQVCCMRQSNTTLTDVVIQQQLFTIQTTEKKIKDVLSTCFAQQHWHEKKIHLLSERHRRGTWLQ